MRENSRAIGRRAHLLRDLFTPLRFYSAWLVSAGVPYLEVFRSAGLNTPTFAFLVGPVISPANLQQYKFESCSLHLSEQKACHFLWSIRNVLISKHALLRRMSSP
jgi:hypothetical protein